MAVREQFAWVWLTALVVVYGAYFATVGFLQTHGGIAFLAEFGLLGAAALAQMIILGVGYVITRAKREARTRSKPDERDRAIEHRAATMGYYVLIVGVILVGCVMPFYASGWQVARGAILAIVIAEIVHQAGVVRAYRSGWQS
jgi:hypothetical protein